MAKINMFAPIGLEDDRVKRISEEVNALLNDNQGKQALELYAMLDPLYPDRKELIIATSMVSISVVEMAQKAMMFNKLEQLSQMLGHNNSPDLDGHPLFKTKGEA